MSAKNSGDEKCTFCGREFDDQYFAVECDFREKTVCNGCSHKDIPDHHYWMVKRFDFSYHPRT